MAAGVSAKRSLWTHNYNSHSVESWQGYAFELICLTHLPQIRKSLGISDISTSASSWRYVPGQNEPGRKAQIDLLIARGDHIINLCEMKFFVGPFVIKKSGFHQSNAIQIGTDHRHRPKP